MKNLNSKILYYFYGILIVVLLIAILQAVRFFYITPAHKDPEIISKFNDTLIVIIPDTRINFSPYKAVYDFDVFFINQIYQGLVKLDPQMVEVPDLAEYWTIDSTHTVYTFYLKKNRFVHNGKRVTARDVAASLKYFLKKVQGSYIKPYFLILEGSEEYIKGMHKDVSGIRIIDDDIIQFRLKHPYVPFLKLLSLVEAKICPEEILNRNPESLQEKPVGSGDYKLAQNSSNIIVLEACPWEKSHEPPYVHYFKFVKLNDSEVVDWVENNKFHINFYYIINLDQTRQDIRSVKVPSLTSTFIGFNCQKFPTNHRLFRKAIFHAVNRQKVVDQFGEIARTARYFCPLYLPRKMEPLSDETHNLRKSKEILSTIKMEFNIENIPEIIFAIDTTLYSSAFLKVIQESCDTLGIPLQIKHYEGLSFEEELSLFKEVHLFVMGWYMDVADPQFYFDVLFNSQQPTNGMQYKNTKVDSLLKIAYHMPYIDKRLELYAEIERIIWDDAPIIPVTYHDDILSYQANLRGLQMNRLGTVSLNLANIWVGKTPL